MQSPNEVSSGALSSVETVGTYEVDSAMLGEGGNAELRSFCRILQGLTEIEIVPIEDAYNGARNSTEVEEIIDAPWAKALELWALHQRGNIILLTSTITAPNGDERG